MSVSLRPKGQTFTRAVIALAAAKGNRPEASKIARERWGPNSPAALVTRAAVSAGSTGGWTEELVAAQDAATEFFALVNQVSIIGRLSGLRRVPFEVRLLSAATGLGASWTAEGAAAPISAGSYNVTSLDRLKVTALTVVTEQLVESSDPDAERVIRGDLVRATAEALDAAFINPANAGSPGVTPAAVTNGLTAVTATGDNTADIAALIAAFEGDLGSAFFVSTPTYAASLAGADRPECGARGGTINGVPLITSRSAPSGSLILIDPQRVAAAEESGDLRVSTQGTIEMSDAPSGDSTTPTATQTISLWQSNSIALGILRFANWRAMPGAVSLLVPA